MIFRKLWPNSHLSWFLQFFVWFICWTILSVDFPKGTAISVHCQWTTHKLQLFLFTSCVSIALCICQVQRPRLYLCRASSVCGCRWVSKALQLNIRCTTSDESRLARVRCVCACFNLTNRMFIEYIICSIFWMKNDSKSTDRIFQLHGVPALLAPANLLYRFDCNEWHTSQSINYEWMNLFPNVPMIFWRKINLIRFFSQIYRLS